VITNVERLDGGWWRGRLRGEVGMFPDNFVKVGVAVGRWHCSVFVGVIASLSDIILEFHTYSRVPYIIGYGISLGTVYHWVRYPCTVY
jgi:hypothetical protein